jgi:hypothetical protein
LLGTLALVLLGVFLNKKRSTLIEK